jgi:endonuclease/exonuclease/phosphatase family metal-dependent hydrolase
VRVLTWNLWWRFGPWEQRRKAILAVLREVAPDVVGLQEVWADDRENLAEWLAAELGMHCTWGESTTPQRGQRRIDDPTIRLGNAVLSRWPAVDTAVVRMPGVDEEDERLVLHARLDAPGQEIPFFTTHLSAPPWASAVRVAQARAAVRFIGERGGGSEFPPVLTGDMNAWPDSDEVRLLGGYKTAPVVDRLVLLDAWEFADPRQPSATWDPANPNVPRRSPPARIDYVLSGQPRRRGVGGVLSVRRAADRPVDGVWASDHFAVVVDLA